MSLRAILLLLLLTLTVTAAWATDAPTVADRLAGSWIGDLQAGSTTLALQFNFVPNAAGGVTGTADSLTQGVLAIPIAEVTLTGDQLRCTLPTIGGVFAATLSVDGQTLAGIWTQGGADLPLTVVHSATGPKALNRPQTPVGPFPYTVEEVTFPSLDTGVTLAGTLTLPADGAGPYPAVVMVTGSGPQDRDETLFMHKPFAVIADALTRAGIAVLRYDDRGTGESTGVYATGTSADFCEDAAGALAYLGTRAEIDQNHRGILGHSDGGLIAPMVAVAHPDDVAFLVLLAAPGLPGSILMYTQIADVGRSSGESEAQYTWEADSWKGCITTLMNETDN
ncbi:MAG: alpha/beta fold hydrolase, partial [bacterium]